MKSDFEKILVRITWEDPRHDWQWFYLLGSKDDFVHLQGADVPDGTVRHHGDSFWVHRAEIESMVDFKLPASAKVDAKDCGNSYPECADCEFNGKLISRGGES